MSDDNPRLLILGAHPDDAEFHAGGLACAYRQLGRAVKMVSVTNGAAGHHELPAEELVPRRRLEAVQAAEIIGADAESWDFPDGSLEPTLAVRYRVIREIREFQPDLVLTHRPCDYHPDHRAVGQCVQDASYLVRVPHVVPDVTALRQDPVVAYMPDLFTRPAPLRPDVVLDVADHLDTIVRMLACHASQVFEWLPWVEGMTDMMPDDETGRMEVLTSWLTRHIRSRADRFRSELIARCGDEAGRAMEFAEIYEISEYARRPDAPLRKTLFPTGYLAAATTSEGT